MGWYPNTGSGGGGGGNFTQVLVGELTANVPKSVPHKLVGCTQFALQGFVLNNNQEFQILMPDPLLPTKNFIIQSSIDFAYGLVFVNVTGGSGTGTIAGLKSGSVSIDVSGTDIVFLTPMPSINYDIVANCYDNSGAVGYYITNQTVDGFTVVPVGDATFVYIAKIVGEIAIYNIKSNSIAVTDAGTDVVFTTDMASINYDIVANCYDNSGAVGYYITNKTVSGFTVMPLTDATFVYIAKLSPDIAYLNIKSGEILATDIGVDVVFATAMPSRDYDVVANCYDGSGIVGYYIINQTVNGFTVISVSDAIFDYLVAPKST